MNKKRRPLAEIGRDCLVLTPKEVEIVRKVLDPKDTLGKRTRQSTRLKGK